MSVKTIDAKLLSKMFLTGAKNLESKKEYINELNVFPVPDGDTGTNMTLTIMSAAKDVNSLDELSMENLCKAISSGSLRGARGNSGVILSQLLRGFTKVVKEYEEIDVAVISAGFDKAVETAYKAVMKPKEGTILTVAKGAAEKANELFENGEEDLDVFFRGVLDYANEVLLKTPEMLPVLKEAGVVDSGGQGLIEVLQGAYDAFCGKEIEFTMDQATSQKAGETRKLNMEVQADMEIKFGYCTEFIIMLNKTFNVKHEMDFKDYLESIGDSIVVVADDEIVKVHVHTNDPGLAIQRALKYGSLSNMKIDNMRLEHQEKLIKMSEQAGETTKEEPAMEKKEVGFISVSVGDGIGEIFKNLGVDYLIEGGQTMNPSTEDMLTAIEKTNADTIYILPNNKNIIMAANQARDLTEDKNVIVIPTKTVPQGISALIGYMPGTSAEDNEAAMLEEIQNVKTGQVTYAVRDTVIEGVEIHQDDYMGIGDSGILANGKDLEAVTIGMIEKMVDDASELISVYYGSDVKEEDVTKLQDKIVAAFPDCDVEFQNGGQPIYYYIVSVE
ncbi:MAG: DAK2 domain-containing protein [Lachnospiraceae bacterium]|nr:DAK2 domain-containing protein [Lachnospiraceae bacterium]MBQ8262610.1 DAK2 domain-containing protein [Lachnospiraceae bacterium]